MSKSIRFVELGSYFAFSWHTLTTVRRNKHSLTYPGENSEKNLNENSKKKKILFSDLVKITSFSRVSYLYMAYFFQSFSLNFAAWIPVDRFLCHATNKWNRNRSMNKAKKSWIAIGDKFIDHLRIRAPGHLYNFQFYALHQNTLRI